MVGTAYPNATPVLPKALSQTFQGSASALTPELWVSVLGPDVTAVSAIIRRKAMRLGGAEKVLVSARHTWTNTFHLYWPLLRVSEDWGCILSVMKPHILPQCNLVTGLGPDSVFQRGRQPTGKSSHLLTFQYWHYSLLRTSRWRFKNKKMLLRF